MGYTFIRIDEVMPAPESRCEDIFKGSLKDAMKIKPLSFSLSPAVEKEVLNSKNKLKSHKRSMYDADLPFKDDLYDYIDSLHKEFCQDISDMECLKEKYRKLWGKYLSLDHDFEQLKKNTACKDITKVIFNPPATIVFWADDTKTVVKCADNECFDPEKGIMAAFMKKQLGNTGAYNYELRRYVADFYLNMVKGGIELISYDDLYDRCVRAREYGTLHVAWKNMEHYANKKDMRNNFMNLLFSTFADTYRLMFDKSGALYVPDEDGNYELFVKDIGIELISYSALVASATEEPKPGCSYPVLSSASTKMKYYAKKKGIYDEFLITPYYEFASKHKLMFDKFGNLYVQSDKDASYERFEES